MAFEIDFDAVRGLPACIRCSEEPTETGFVAIGGLETQILLLCKLGWEKVEAAFLLEEALSGKPLPDDRPPRIWYGLCKRCAYETEIPGTKMVKRDAEMPTRVWLDLKGKLL